MEPKGPPDPEYVHTPSDLLEFVQTLSEDLVRDEKMVAERMAQGEKYVSGVYESYRLSDALESLGGWLEDRFTDESYQPLPEASDPARADVWREVAKCLVIAATYE